MIEFIAEILDSPSPKFEEVKLNQFFISRDSHLFQKMNEEEACMIADEEGTPSSALFDFSSNEEIIRILPKIQKIKFE